MWIKWHDQWLISQSLRELGFDNLPMFIWCITNAKPWAHGLICTDLFTPLDKSNCAEIMSFGITKNKVTRAFKKMFNLGLIYNIKIDKINFIRVVNYKTYQTAFDPQKISNFHKKIYTKLSNFDIENHSENSIITTKKVSDNSINATKNNSEVDNTNIGNKEVKPDLLQEKQGGLLSPLDIDYRYRDNNKTPHIAPQGALPFGAKENITPEPKKTKARKPKTEEEKMAAMKYGKEAKALYTFWYEIYERKYGHKYPGRGYLDMKVLNGILERLTEKHEPEEKLAMAKRIAAELINNPDPWERDKLGITIQVLSRRLPEITRRALSPMRCPDGLTTADQITGQTQPQKDLTHEQFKKIFNRGLPSEIKKQRGII